MSTRLGFLVRKMDEIEEERGTCGFRRRIVTIKDGKEASVSFLRLDNAKKHYHKISTEFYYFLEGKGGMELGEKRVEVKPGTLVKIKPGTAHKSLGKMKALIMAVPSLDPDDVYYI